MVIESCTQMKATWSSSTRDTDEDDNEDTNEDDLELQYEEACNETAELERELRAAKLEAQQLRLRLAAAQTSKIGSDVHKAPVVLPGVENELQAQRIQGVHDMFKWIAEHVDLSHTDTLDVGCEVPIGGRTVHLERVVQWALPSAPSKRLKLSVPVEHQDEIVGLLKTVKSTGRLGPPSFVQQLADTWELVPGELSTPSQPCAEAAVLLAHRTSSKGILVATWPTHESLKAFALMFASDGFTPSAGQRVEVFYEGYWFAGTFETMDTTGQAVVKCDVDDPGIFTVVPLHQVRSLSARGTSPDENRVPAAAGNAALPANPEKASVRCGFQHRRSRSAS